MSTASTPAAATPGPGDAPGAEAAAVGQRDPREALRTPVFRTLTAGWALTNFADSLLTLILAVWVNDLTGNPLVVVDEGETDRHHDQIGRASCRERVL